MKTQTLQHYIQVIKSYLFKRILFACLGFAGALFFLLTLTVFRGSTAESGAVIGIGYGLISTLVITAIVLYKVHYGSSKVYILAVWHMIKRRRLYILRKSRSIKQKIHREDYGFQTSSLHDLAH